MSVAATNMSATEFRAAGTDLSERRRTGVSKGAVIDLVPAADIGVGWGADGAATIGAFTTMSTYAVEACLLVRDGHAASAALYATTSVAAGVFAAWLGTRVAPR